MLSGVQVTGGGIRDLSGATQDGGGIYISYSPGEITVNNTWVYSCTARRGGGVFIQSVKATLNNVPIWNSRAKESGGGIYIWQNDKGVLITANPSAVMDGRHGLVQQRQSKVEAFIIAYQIQPSPLLDCASVEHSQRLYGNGGGIYLQNASGNCTCG